MVLCTVCSTDTTDTSGYFDTIAYVISYVSQSILVLICTSCHVACESGVKCGCALVGGNYGIGDFVFIRRPPIENKLT